MNETSDIRIPISAANVACPPDVDASFGPIVQGCRDNFDFTFAFEQYFLSIAPSVLFLLLGSVRLAVLHKKSVVIVGQRLRTIKLVTIGIFAALQLSLLILWSTSSEAENLRKQAVTGAALSTVVAVLLFAISYSEHRKSIRPSWILNAFLFFTILFDAAILRTLYLSSFPRGIRISSTLAFAVKIILLALEASPKRGPTENADAQRSPEEYTGPFSQGLYWWLNSLIHNGFKNVLSIEDLFPLSREMKTEKLNAQFWAAWNKSSDKSKNNLGLILLKILKTPLLLAVFPRVILIGFIFCQPFLLERFLGYLRNPVERKDANLGKAMIGAYAVVYTGMAITSAFYWYRSIRCVTMMRGIIITAIYTKTTEISITALNNAESVTLMSGDVENLARSLREIHELWAAIVQIAIATWLLARQLGAACVGPMIVCLVAALIMGGTSGFAQKYQMTWLGEVQRRTGITSSVMGSLKGIKMLGLSNKMRDLVAKLRYDEVSASKKFRRLAVYSATLAFVPLMISPVVTFAIFLGVAAKNSDKTLDATRLFTSLSLLILITQPLFGVFEDIFSFRSAMASLNRIEAFLQKETRGDHRFVSSSSNSQLASNTNIASSTEEGIELGQVRFQRTEYLDGNSTILQVQDGAFGWKIADGPVIRDLNASVKAGELVMICGPVAAGKSTLLKSFLGETLNFKGFVRLSTKSIAYCDQTPWLMNASIKENIAGFSQFDALFYKQVLHACDLNTDCATLDNGDDTMVGSKGVTLSGGQKQRVALARALYSRKQLVVLDDIFSGLDGNTQHKVFNRVFGKHGILRRLNSTVILATHALHLLRHADQILVLGEEGRIIEQGGFNDLLGKEDGYVRRGLRDLEEQEKDKKLDDNDEASQNLDLGGDENTTKQTSKESAAPDGSSQDRQSGDWTFYTYFFSKMGPNLTIAFFVLEALWAFFSAFPTIWLKWWSDANENSPNENSGMYLGVYAALQVAGLLSSALLTWCCIDIVARRAGIKLHDVLINTVMAASMGFVSKTDVGSLVNRFTQDLGLIDRQLPIAIMCCASNLFIAVAQGVLISTASPYIAISFPALILAFYFVQKYYLRTSRQLRLLDLEAKSPVYTLFLESLEGLSTIRAFGWQKECVERNYQLVDTAQKPFYLLAIIQKWLTLVLDLMTAVLAVIVVSVAVITRETVSVGFTGVALTQIISFTDYLKMFMLFWTQLETSLGAISRIRQFNRDTPRENLPRECEDVPPEWPEAGGIEIQRLSAGYSDSMVLKDISIIVRGGEKIGICGRTGSGKSSLVMALLRMLEIDSGTITIDGIDVTTISREKIRSVINVISQDPFFFAGTIRHNVDPYDSAIEDEIKDVLRKCQLEHLLEGDKGLDSELQPDTLSHGQRQLFCLARALLRKGKIVILDEATSSVDKDTDEIMQRVIREEMAGKTIIAIAHRLNTILDADRVIVLEDGRVAEIDSPSALLSIDSKFRQLVNAAEQG